MGRPSSISLAEHMAARTFPEPNTGCFLWGAKIDNKGYGAVAIRGKWLRAHRVAYELKFGPIPPTLTIDHLCRVRSCVNPDHLEAVTFRENVLRGIGVTAGFAKQTQCKRGHSLIDESNVYRYNGSRCCRMCRKAAAERRAVRLRKARP